MELDFAVNADWVAGMLLASIRVAAFVVVSPIFKAFPATGRMVLVIVLGYAFADPISGSGDIATLLVAGFTNTVVGLTLGFLTGIIFYLFTVGGALIDFTSSLSAASIFDPVSSEKVTVFGRIFNIMALAMFLLLGGDRMLVAGMGVSFDAVGITGTISLSSGLADVAVELMGRMMIGAIEMAMPALAALFIAEVVLGIAAFRQHSERDFAQSGDLSMTLDNLRVSTFGDAAFAYCDVTVSGTAGGEAFQMPGLRCTFGLVRTAEGWRFAQTHLSAPASGQEQGSSF